MSWALGWWPRRISAVAVAVVVLGALTACAQSPAPTQAGSSPTASPSVIRIPSPTPSTGPVASETPAATPTQDPLAAAAEAKAQRKAQRAARSERRAARLQARYQPDREVWQVAQPAHAENPDNPLAGRTWGVYTGDREHTWTAYEAASGETRSLLGRIALRPKALWLGDWSGSPESIGGVVDDYIADASGGDPDVLVQMAIFRMVPWEHAVCDRTPSGGEQDAYRRWITNAARAIGDQHTAVILQPDLPFWWCADRSVTSALIRHAVDAFEAQPNTSVYLDAGAADWSSVPQMGAPSAVQAAEMLLANGIERVRGFALNATHYVGTAESVAYGARLVEELAARGVEDVHFVVDTAQNGNGMLWPEVDADGAINDNARVCGSVRDRAGCVTLGIPPTSRVGDPRWGLTGDLAAQAREHADGFLWFSRPWLHMQADWHGSERAVGLARSTGWPGPPL